MPCLGRQIAGSRKVVCENWDASEVTGAVMVGSRKPRAGEVNRWEEAGERGEMMGVKKEREKTRTRKSGQVFFKVSQEVRAPAPEVYWVDKNGLARGG